jgi:CheY-like chemotaxis protein
MRNVRYHPDLSHAAGSMRRFNVLLTEDRWGRPEHWSRQLPRLMEPLGVASYTVRSGEEALDLVKRVPLHAAVVDLATPRVSWAPAQADDVNPAQMSGTAPQAIGSPDNGGIPGGLWLLELLRRLPRRPPVVIVHSRTITQRDVMRLMTDALRLGAFTVMENPVQLESLLAVFRRLLDRLYQGQWPDSEQNV